MPPALPSRALTSSSDDVGAALLALPEDQWFDRKSARIQAAQLAVTEIAMANAEGGAIVVGLSDGAVEGTDKLAAQRNELMQAAVDHADPPVRASCDLVPCINSRGTDDHLLVIHVEPSEVVHTTRKDECYLRVGDENRRLRFGQRQELEFDKGQSHFDGTPVPDADVEDLDDDLVRTYLDAVGGTDIQRTLQARLLLTRRGEMTAGGLLLFGRQPQARFPEAYLRVLRFAGVERTTGRRQNLTEDVRCEGPIPNQIAAAESVVERVQPARRVLGPEGRFVREGMIPKDAWLEGIVNAAAHRSYSLGGDHVRVEVYDNRIEIESPGRFPGLVELDDPRRVGRFARNPRIARVCSELGFGQELGEGVRRMFDEMRTAGLGDPVYRQRPGSVVLILPATPLSPQTAARLPPRSREVMEMIREVGGLSTGDVADGLGLSKPATLKRLRALEEAGLVEWVGKTATDPRAYWRLRSD